MNSTTSADLITLAESSSESSATNASGYRHRPGANQKSNFQNLLPSLPLASSGGEGRGEEARSQIQNQNSKFQNPSEGCRKVNVGKRR